MKRKNDAMKQKLFGKTTVRYINKLNYQNILMTERVKKKIDLRQWFGVLKGKDRSAAEMNKEIMEYRAKTSKDFDERMQKLRPRMKK